MIHARILKREGAIACICIRWHLGKVLWNVLRLLWRSMEEDERRKTKARSRCNGKRRDGKSDPLHVCLAAAAYEDELPCERGPGGRRRRKGTRLIVSSRHCSCTGHGFWQIGYLVSKSEKKVHPVPVSGAALVGPWLLQVWKRDLLFLFLLPLSASVGLVYCSFLFVTFLPIAVSPCSYDCLPPRVPASLQISRKGQLEGATYCALL